MLIAILTAFLVGIFGGSPGHTHVMVKEMRSRAKQAVPEPSRRKDVLSSLDYMDKDLTEFDKSVGQAAHALLKLVERYDARQDDFSAVLRDLETSHATTEEKLLASRFKIRKLLSPHEWESLVDERAPGEAP